jgi:hypothetical protein
VNSALPVRNNSRAVLKSLGVNLVDDDVEKDPVREKEWWRNGVRFIDIEGVILPGFIPMKIRAAIEEKRPSWIIPLGACAC